MTTRTIERRNAQKPEEVLDESEIATQPEASPEKIAEVIRLAREQVRLSNEVDRAENDLKEAKRLLDLNKVDQLPKVMKETSLTVCPLDNGYKVELVPIVRASIPSATNKKVPDAEERNRKGIEYMDETAPDMVDTIVTIRYPKGTEEDLAKLLRDNKKRKKPLELELTRTVNTQSLSAWVRKRDAAGLPTDEDKLTIHRVTMAEVKAPPKKKGEISVE
jgi:hypothetical protein